MASLTQWTWIWEDSVSCWWTGRPGVLRFMGSQRVGHDWVSELNWRGTEESLDETERKGWKSWLQTQHSNSRWQLSMTATEINPDFSIISNEADLPKPHDKEWLPHWYLDLSPDSLAPSIHTYLGIWPLPSFSLYSWAPSFAPEKWQGLAEKPQDLFISKEYWFWQRFITFQPSMYLGQERMHDRMLRQPRKWFPHNTREMEMATHSSVLTWRILQTGEPGGLLSIVLYKVSHDWSDLEAAAAAYNTHYIKIKFWDSGHVLQGKSK